MPWYDDVKGRCTDMVLMQSLIRDYVVHVEFGKGEYELIQRKRMNYARRRDTGW